MSAPRLFDRYVIGMTIWQEWEGWGTEAEGDNRTIPPGGVIIQVDADTVETILPGVPGHPGGLRHSTIRTDRIHDCGHGPEGDPPCLHDPIIRSNDVRYVIRMLCRLVGEGHGPLTAPHAGRGGIGTDVGKLDAAMTLLRTL